MMEFFKLRLPAHEIRLCNRYGDIFVDTALSFAVYQRWKALTRPAPGPGGLRRPLWIPRVVRPEEAAFYIPTKKV
jgi:hypothetical protein